MAFFISLDQMAKNKSLGGSGPGGGGQADLMIQMDSAVQVASNGPAALVRAGGVRVRACLAA
jgi:hypothetical protein